MGSRREGFTSAELVVVVAIVAVLGVLSSAAVKGARESSESASCLRRSRRLGEAVSLFCLDSDGYLPKNRNRGMNQDVDGGAGDEGTDDGGARSGGWWGAAEGWDAPGPLPGENSHMGHWQNQIYEYVPDATAFVCQTWANSEDWTMKYDKPEAVAGPPWNGKYLMKDNWAPGNPWVPHGEDSFGVHTSDAQTSVITDVVFGYKERVGELARPEATYLYMEAWPANAYGLGGKTLSPHQWGGFHNMSRAVSYTFQSESMKHYGTQRLGDRMMIFGDGHAELMSWRKMRCFADSSDPETGWVVDWIDPRGEENEDSTRYAEAEGVPGGDWASCVKTPGEQ